MEERVAGGRSILERQTLRMETLASLEDQNAYGTTSAAAKKRKRCEEATPTTRADDGTPLGAPSMVMDAADGQLRAAGAKRANDSGCTEMCEKHSAAAQGTAQWKEGSDQLCQQPKPPTHEAPRARRGTARPYMHDPDERPPCVSGSASHLRTTPSMLNYDSGHRLQTLPNGKPKVIHEPPGNTFENDDVDVELQRVLELSYSAHWTHACSEFVNLYASTALCDLHDVSTKGFRKLTKDGEAAAQRFKASLHELFRMGLSTETIQDNPAFPPGSSKRHVWCAWVTLVSSDYISRPRTGGGDGRAQRLAAVGYSPEPRRR